jgi:hypothetical protein
MTCLISPSVRPPERGPGLRARVLGGPFGRAMLAGGHGVRAILVLVCLLFLGIVACGGSWDGSVGAIFGKDNRTGRVFVREAPPGLGAARAGVREGDEVTEIDGKPVVTMSPEEVHRALGGKVGSRVTLVLAGPAGVRTVAIERSPLREAERPVPEVAR